MSGDAVSFILELEDRLSRPAKAATGAVGALITKLETMRGVMGQLEAHAKKADGRFAELAASLGQLGSKPLALWDLGNAALFAGGELVKLAAAGGVLALGVTAYALHAADFQERTRGALEIVEGTRGEANATFELLRKMANAGGLPTEQVSRFYTSLREVGFEAQSTRTLIAAALDVGAVNPGGAEALTNVFAHIGATGKFDRRAVRGLLRGTGLTETDLAGALSAMPGAFKGQTVASIQAAMEAGRIPAATGIEAIVETIHRKFDRGGGVGAGAMAIQGQSLAGQLQTLKNQIDELLGDSIVVGPFTQTLATLSGLLDGSTAQGKALRATLAGAFASLATSLNGLDAGALGRFVSGATELVAVAIRGSAAFGTSFMGALRPFLAVLRGVGEVIGMATGEGNGLVAILGAIGRVLGFIVGVVAIAIGGVVAIVVGLGEGFVWLVGKLGGLGGMLLRIGPSLALPFVMLWDILGKIGPGLLAVLEWIGGALVAAGKWLYDGAVGIGKAIVAGLTGGAIADLSKVGATFADVGKKAIEAASTTLGVHSPSRVFDAIGRYTVLGFVEGIGAENDNAYRAMTDAVTPPRAAVIRTNHGGGAGALSVGDIHIQVTIEAREGLDADALAEASAMRIRRELLAIFEEMGISLGAATLAA